MPFADPEKNEETKTAKRLFESKKLFQKISSPNSRYDSPAKRPGMERTEGNGSCQMAFRKQALFSKKFRKNSIRCDPADFKGPNSGAYRGKKSEMPVYSNDQCEAL